LEVENIMEVISKELDPLVELAHNWYTIKLYTIKLLHVNTRL
jgi:hypothetical protein